VIDNHSKRIDARRRFRVTARWVEWLVLASIACSWLFLYFDSVHQRRRAESLFADLKSLDFATAGFPEVRDIMVRYGGRALQPNSCTPQNCTFLLQIMTVLPRIPILDRTAQFLYTTLPYIGVRSWTADAFFRVRNGKLDSSQTGVWQFRMERLDSREYKYLVPLGYDVETRLDPTDFYACNNQPYRVFISHPRRKFPTDALETCLLQSAGTPTKRAFDVHLRCLNNPFRNCRFDELAPSAWADYSAKDGGTGTRDPFK
jgi:hypothetical protein